MISAKKDEVVLHFNEASDLDLTVGHLDFQVRFNRRGAKAFSFCEGDRSRCKVVVGVSAARLVGRNVSDACA